jgi:hypothetical protein
MNKKGATKHAAWLVYIEMFHLSCMSHTIIKIWIQWASTRGSCSSGTTWSNCRVIPIQLNDLMVTSHWTARGSFHQLHLFHQTTPSVMAAWRVFFSVIQLLLFFCSSRLIHFEHVQRSCSKKSITILSSDFVWVMKDNVLNAFKVSSLPVFCLKIHRRYQPRVTQGLPTSG